MKKEEDKKKLDERCQELINQNVKLTKQVISQMALQGAMHLIWDEIIREDNKFRLYLDYIVDQESALKVARQNILIVKQGLNKKPMQVAQKAINFLSTLSEYQVKRFGIHDKVIIAS